MKTSQSVLPQMHGHWFQAIIELFSLLSSVSQVVPLQLPHISNQILLLYL